MSEATEKTSVEDRKKIDAANNFITNNAALPHIQLDDTDNYIVGTDNGCVILSSENTDLVKDYDFLTIDRYNDAVAEND